MKKLKKIAETIGDIGDGKIGKQKFLLGAAVAVGLLGALSIPTGQAEASFEWRPPQDVVGTMQVLDDGAVLVDPAYATSYDTRPQPITAQPAQQPVQAQPMRPQPVGAPVPVDLSDIPAEALLDHPAPAPTPTPTISQQRPPQQQPFVDSYADEQPAQAMLPTPRRDYIPPAPPEAVREQPAIAPSVMADDHLRGQIPDLAPLPTMLDSQGRAAGLAGGSGATVSRANPVAPLSLTSESAQYQASAPTMPVARSAAPMPASLPPAMPAGQRSSGYMSIEDIRGEPSRVAQQDYVRQDFTPPVATQGRMVRESGSGVPLVIALRQIVPTDYEFRYGEGVDLGVMVGWQSGRPWRETVERMITPLGLEAHVDGNIVALNRLGEGRVETATRRPTLQETYPDTIGVASGDFGAPQNLLGAAAGRDSVVHNIRSSQQDSVQPQQDYVDLSTPSTSAKLLSEDDAAAQPLKAADIRQVQAIPPQEMGTEAVIRAQQQQQQQASVNELPPIAFQMPYRGLEQEMVWYGTNGSMLSDVVKRWAQRAGVEMNWESEHDFPLRATVVITGTFQEAVRKILEGFDQADPRPIGRLFRNTADGPSVLVIEEQFLIR